MLFGLFGVRRVVVFLRQGLRCVGVERCVPVMLKVVLPGLGWWEEVWHVMVLMLLVQCVAVVLLGVCAFAKAVELVVLVVEMLSVLPVHVPGLGFCRVRGRCQVFLLVAPIVGLVLRCVVLGMLRVCARGLLRPRGCGSQDVGRSL